jgi:hypothetical protein
VKASILLIVSLALAACATAPDSTSPSSSAASAGGEEVRFTSAELRKLDERLRAMVRGEGELRVPVRVVFSDAMPSRDELLELLLVRQDRYAVGNVTRDVLKRIVARDDVERVSLIEDTGYGEG